MANTWSAASDAYLSERYPKVGVSACAELMGRSKASIRARASRLGLKLEHGTDFTREWQARAAASKVGKKRPEQAEVMRELHRNGKLRMTDATKAKLSDTSKAAIARNGHPRGALGLRHSDSAKAKIAAAAAAAWSRKTDDELKARTVKSWRTRERNGTNIRERPEASWKGGWRIIGGKRRYYRSRWEANYARYLEWLKSLGQIADWKHESKTFWFDGIKRGCVSYLPDFEVTNIAGPSEFHEVKGWMDDRSKTKIARMARYFPEVKLIVIDSKAYRAIKRKVSAIVPDWE